MGFYLRKSIRVGPLRFNLSKSGVGVSGGVRGFRIGAGPRGNYVHMGLGGVYYRATLPPGCPQSPSPSIPSMDPRSPAIPTGSHDPLAEIESLAASTIVDGSSAELLREIDEKRRRMRWWPLVLSATLLACFVVLGSSWWAWLLPLVALAGAIGTWFVYQRDLLAKTVVLFYSMDQDMEQAYGLLHEWASQLAACSRAWHIAAQGDVRDRKYHAGASSLVRRHETFIKKAEPPFLQTNVETVALGVGRQVLYFFPDRVLIFDTTGVGAVGYSQLRIGEGQTRFIEDGPVPSDAMVVDHTWRYVNKKGGPDRRFKDNPQLPICLYDELSLQSDTGLNELIQVSRSGVADGFVKAINYLGARMPAEVTSATSA